MPVIFAEVVFLQISTLGYSKLVWQPFGWSPHFSKLFFTAFMPSCWSDEDTVERYLGTLLPQFPQCTMVIGSSGA